MKKIILQMNEAGQVYGPDDWFVGGLDENKHFGEYVDQDDHEKQRRLMRLLDTGLKPEQIIDLKREGLL